MHAIQSLHPDGKRITGLAVAITFNALLLMLVMAPVRLPQGVGIPDHPPPAILWYTPRVEVPVVVPVVPPSRPVVPRVDRARVDTQSPPVPVVVDAGETVVPPQPVVVASTGPDVAPTMAPGMPVAGVRLEYLDAPAPEYPRAALRMRIEGTVLLQVLVDTDGRPLQVTVQQGSGDRRLDAAARAQVLGHWRFRPAMRDGRAVQAIGLVPIVFRLD
jgi:protein TonB